MKGDWSIDSGLPEDAREFNGNIVSLKYFGDCKNTVDIDHMWDATQMAGVIGSSKIVPYSSILCDFGDGDRKVPSKFRKWMAKNEESLENTNKIVFGVNEVQRIFFAYIEEFDVHFFFDAGMDNWKELA